jgi:hypothetical protein
MTTSVRKLALTAHVASSVGWLGAVAVFLALAVAGLSGQDERLVRAAYLSMNLMTWFVIVPLCVASLATGIIQSLGTPWGLLRHYWVVVKLVLTALATFVLLVHTRPIGYLADVAGLTSPSAAGLGDLQRQLVGDAGAALVVLLTTTALSVYKPQGLTPYGWRTRSEPRAMSAAGR